MGWNIETVDSGGNVGYACSIAIASGNYAHIAYCDTTNSKLKYAYRDSGGWNFENAADFNAVDQSTLVFDASGYPHIVCCDSPNYDLNYVYKDGTGWHWEKPDESGNTGRMPSLALDALGYPHVSYYDAAANYLNYAYKNGTGWHIEAVALYDLNHNATRTTRIALGSDGYPRIAYTDTRITARVYFAYKDGDGWHAEQVSDYSSPDYGRAWCGGMALDEDDYPHICYFWRNNSATVFNLRYSYQDGAGWHTEIVDTFAGALWYLYNQDLELGSDGMARVSYNALVVTGGANYLLYAERQGLDSWTVETIEDSIYVLDNNIALVSGRWPHICYYDATSANRDLKHAWVEALVSRTDFILG